MNPNDFINWRSKNITVRTRLGKSYTGKISKLEGENVFILQDNGKTAMITCSIVIGIEEA